ncbi:hypothetical protein DXG03_003097 [Asterophora parasitica]|uniref:RMT2 domain-containing protein n=1 Tax=Asterophora parasitica TaxID=117018 RepID=A0A9P7GEI3_9AGAR|nr:hypothetical protein DXG03_003097 [Asterophora parasitica]
MSGQSDTVDAEIQALSSLGDHLVDSIIADEPLEVIKAIIASDAPVWYQNDEEGTSPLHAAAYSQNSELAKILIEKGAVWNAVDNLKNTAGDIALSLNDTETYNIIRNAGIRAELLLSLLTSKASIESSSTIVLKETDSTATGSTDAFLSSELTYIKDSHGQDICLLKVGEEEVGVMMGWEQEIMEDTARRLCNGHPNASNLKVLNVGFGLGIIDGLFQSLDTPPTQHVIIEPHRDVLQHMKERGWYEKPGVKILEGKWQDFVNHNELLDVGGFDVIYTDTFSEDYGDLHQFFQHLPDLLAGPESRFSFFNGLGATSEFYPLFYDVYTHIAELHLADVGIDMQWSDVDVSFDAKDDRWGDSRKYFSLPLYRLPIGAKLVWGTGTNMTLKFESPRDTLSSGSGIVVAVNDMSTQSPMTPLLQTPVPSVALSSTGLAFDEEAKLVYGVILSLRNMVKKLSGRDEQFVNYRTSAYKLHLYETPTGYKLVMLSDPNTDSLRFVLRQIYVGPFLEYVVRNPLVKIDSREHGIDNEYFRASIDRLVRGLSVFS